MVAPAVTTSTDTAYIAATMHLWLAPSGTTLPSAVPASHSAYASDNLLNAAFKDVGYTDNDGASFKITREVQKFFAHQKVDPILAQVKSREVELDGKLIEFKADNLIALFGGTATSVTGGMKYVPEVTSDVTYGVGVADFLFADRLLRIVLPKCYPSGSGDIAAKKDALSMLPLTLVGLAPDDATPAFHIFSSEDVS